LQAVTSTSSEPAGRRRRVARYVAVALASIVALTLVFSAQAVMRPGSPGARDGSLRTLALNALDWTVWAVLAPLIAVATKRYRLDAPQGRRTRVAVWLAFALACATAMSLVTGPFFYRWWLQMPPGVARPSLPQFLVLWLAQSLGWNLITFFMIAGVFHAALYYNDLRARQLREADLEARLARSELNVLRMQLQPHFFFNALHTVSALMVSDVPTAHRVLAALSDLVRSSLDHTAQQEIPLRDELEFVNRYVEIQRARFRDRLSVEIDIADGALDAMVPSLVLQPLVDNAIRHGIEAHRRRGQIWIRAVHENGTLVLTVRDNASPELASPSSSALPRAAPGIGLFNLGARLAQLYGSAHAFSAGRDGEGCFTVTMRIPFHLERTHTAAQAATA
jgi:two-component system, LytTR family, sensor kinase